MLHSIFFIFSNFLFVPFFRSFPLEEGPHSDILSRTRFSVFLRISFGVSSSSSSRCNYTEPQIQPRLSASKPCSQVEIALFSTAYGSSFIFDPWNILDFFVVVISLIFSIGTLSFGVPLAEAHIQPVVRTDVRTGLSAKETTLKIFSIFARGIFV